MAKKIIRLTEEELREVVKDATVTILEERCLLTEMPYERNDFLYMVDKDARNAYIHLAKLLLYNNTTNDANKWINDIVNNFTIPMLTAKVYISQKARAKVLINGYINNFFGKDFVDYDYQMEDFCLSAIKDMEDKAKKVGNNVPPHNDIKQSLILGKSVIIAYASAVAQLTNGTTQEIANAKLQNTIRDKVSGIFNLDTQQ